MKMLLVDESIHADTYGRVNVNMQILVNVNTYGKVNADIEK